MSKWRDGIQQMLDVSTAHITREDSGVLVEWSRMDESPCLLASYEHGWWLHVWEEGCGPIEQDALSESFLKILKLCRSLDISYLKLDSDGTEHDDLDVHDW